MESIVAYLDLIGFREYCKQNPRWAAEMLIIYQDIISTKLEWPATSFKHEFANTNIESFECFLPFSDSIFVLGLDQEKFLIQLCNFLIQCFTIRSSALKQPHDKNDPSKILLRDGKVIHWYPCLFTGGITRGQIDIIETNYIFDSKLVKVNNISGPAVVEAVGLTEKNKGVKLTCSKVIYDELSDKLKQYTRVCGEDYEILWPALGFYNYSGMEYYYIQEMIRPISNLWHAYNHRTYGHYYYKLLSLIVDSIVLFYENERTKAEGIDLLKKEFEVSNLISKENELLGLHYA